MKIALCTTTIHVPHALKLLRKCSADVHFFVAFDQNIEKGAIIMVEELGGKLVKPVMRGHPEWKCSQALGWNTIARRNIAFLEALKWGADLIVSWDDDNIPVSLDYFNRFAWAVGHPFNGLKASGYDNWFDPGFLLVPRTKHRGFPHDKPRMVTIDHVENARVGVAAGLVLGDPDIDATTRIATDPDIQSVSEIGRTGIVVDLHTWTVFNSQNTAVVRELIPAWFMMPGVGRHDDIYASLIVQRVARERGLHVHFGPPFTYQQRNAHNIVTDLRAEIDGMENVTKLATLLDHILLPGKSVIADTRIIYEQLQNCAFIPRASAVAGLIWLEDCEGVL